MARQNPRGGAAIESLERRTLLATAIASGQTITANIGAAHEADTYTIHGVAGGTLLACVGETSANAALSLQVELHAPTGALLASRWDYVGTVTAANNLAVTGTYTVVVRDHGGTS